MEELQRVDVVLDANDGAVEAERVVDQVLQTVEVDVVAKEGAGHVVGYILESHRGHIVDERLGQVVNLLGHVESAVFGQAFHHGLAQVGLWGLMVGAVVLHSCVIV